MNSSPVTIDSTTTTSATTTTETSNNIDYAKPATDVANPPIVPTSTNEETKNDDKVKQSPTKKRKTSGNRVTIQDFIKQRNNVIGDLLSFIEQDPDIGESRATLLKIVKKYQSNKELAALQRCDGVCIPFGKHQGKSIRELWNDDQGKGSGRSYLLWLCNQSWVFEDIRAAINALKDSL